MTACLLIAIQHIENLLREKAEMLKDYFSFEIGEVYTYKFTACTHASMDLLMYVYFRMAVSILFQCYWVPTPPIWTVCHSLSSDWPLRYVCTTDNIYTVDSQCHSVCVCVIYGKVLDLRTCSIYLFFDSFITLLYSYYM